MPQNNNDRAARFAAAVNRQGYAFQNTVLKRCVDLEQAGRSRWVFEASEFPTEVNGGGTRIDFVLWTHETNYWLLAECKRVNPRIADWYFARVSHIRRGISGHDRFIAERAHVTPNGTFLSEGVGIDYLDAKDVAHRGFEVKTDKAGEASSSREPIEEACSQIMRGLNGMATYLNGDRAALGPHQGRILIPVIFTTANLWANDGTLADADLATGNISAAAMKPVQVPYVFYQYHLSPGIKHQFAPPANPNASLFVQGLSLALAQQFIRTIPIVSAEGIDTFLSDFHVGRFSPADILS